MLLDHLLSRVARRLCQRGPRGQEGYRTTALAGSALCLLRHALGLVVLLAAAPSTRGLSAAALQARSGVSATMTVTLSGAPAWWVSRMSSVTASSGSFTEIGTSRITPGSRTPLSPSEQMRNLSPGNVARPVRPADRSSRPSRYRTRKALIWAGAGFATNLLMV